MRARGPIEQALDQRKSWHWLAFGVARLLAGIVTRRSLSRLRSLMSRSAGCAASRRRLLDEPREGAASTAPRLHVRLQCRQTAERAEDVLSI